jgi:hypothetical protein
MRRWARTQWPFGSTKKASPSDIVGVFIALGRERRKLSAALQTGWGDACCRFSGVRVCAQDRHDNSAVWGAIGGAVAAMIIGFVWGGWVTGGTAGKMETASAEAAVVLAFTPLCVAKAQQQPDQLALLKAESSYNRGDFVIKAGWVDNVSDKYRSAVAKACASTAVEGMK